MNDLHPTFRRLMFFRSVNVFAWRHRFYDPLHALVSFWKDRPAYFEFTQEEFMRDNIGDYLLTAYIAYHEGHVPQPVKTDDIYEWVLDRIGQGEDYDWLHSFRSSVDEFVLEYNSLDEEKCK